jgi:hypothetical protein
MPNNEITDNDATIDINKNSADSGRKRSADEISWKNWDKDNQEVIDRTWRAGVFTLDKYFDQKKEVIADDEGREKLVEDIIEKMDNKEIDGKIKIFGDTESFCLYISTFEVSRLVYFRGQVDRSDETFNSLFTSLLTNLLAGERSLQSLMGQEEAYMNELGTQLGALARCISEFYEQAEKPSLQLLKRAKFKSAGDTSLDQSLRDAYRLYHQHLENQMDRAEWLCKKLEQQQKILLWEYAMLEKSKGSVDFDQLADEKQWRVDGDLCHRAVHTYLLTFEDRDKLMQRNIPNEERR